EVVEVGEMYEFFAFGADQKPVQTTLAGAISVAVDVGAADEGGAEHAEDDAGADVTDVGAAGDVGQSCGAGIGDRGADGGFDAGEDAGLDSAEGGSPGEVGLFAAEVDGAIAVEVAGDFGLAVAVLIP